MASFLDKVGLSYFYGKIKAKLDKKLDKNLGVANKDKYLAINTSVKRYISQDIFFAFPCIIASAV